ncbi:hypothetical protein V8E36_005251 [Tilletia maclaganii]
MAGFLVASYHSRQRSFSRAGASHAYYSCQSASVLTTLCPYHLFSSIKVTFARSSAASVFSSCARNVMRGWADTELNLRSLLVSRFSFPIAHGQGAGREAKQPAGDAIGACGLLGIHTGPHRRQARRSVHPSLLQWVYLTKPIPVDNRGHTLRRPHYDMYIADAVAMRSGRVEPTDETAWTGKTSWAADDSMTVTDMYRVGAASGRCSPSSTPTYDSEYHESQTVQRPV